MRQAFAEQHQVTRSEGADGITDETRALPCGEQGQLHLLVEVPVIPLPLDRLSAAWPEDAFDFTEGLRPSQYAEGVPLGQLDPLADGFHRVIRIRRTPSRKGLVEMIVPPKETPSVAIPRPSAKMDLSS